MSKAERILENFIANLDLEISKKTDPFHLSFLMAHRAKGNVTDEDLVELRGYYKGLKTAKAILEKVIDIAEIEGEENE